MTIPPAAIPSAAVLRPFSSDHAIALQVAILCALADQWRAEAPAYLWDEFELRVMN